MTSLDRDVAKPLYRMVQERLLVLIGSLSPGETIPTEPELEAMFEVSRATVRRAVEELVVEGLLEKRQGFGTIVRDVAGSQEVGRVYSWTEEMRRRKVDTRSRLLSLESRQPSEALLHELQMDPDERVVVISRVRYIKGTPTAIMINYLREQFVPGLVESGLSSESLYADLRDRYNLSLHSGTESIHARIASAVEAALLDVEENAPILSVRRRTHLAIGTPIEVVDMAARGDRYHYHAALEPDRARRIHPPSP